MICPTATAAVVVTQKLGGNHSSVITYVMLINLVVALVIPALCPLLHPVQDESFWGAFYLVVSTIFPVIIFPLFAAELLRYICPKLREYIASKSNLSFIIWLVALSIAIAMTTRSIYHSKASVLIMIGIATGSLIACAFQFWMGGILGRKYGDSVAATQSLGQKNTIFAIWLSYTYLSPIVSVAGGFYSIWHNLYNTYQLSKMKK
jgi:BASS family bile acid:Na+ symporter